MVVILSGYLLIIPCWWSVKLAPQGSCSDWLVVNCSFSIVWEVNSGQSFNFGMNSMKVVILVHSLYWSIHIKDESKRGTAFAFIFGVN